MTGRHVLSPRAQGDVDDIWNYTVKRWGEDQAEIYIRQVFEQIRAVARTPGMGRSRAELRAGYFTFPAGSHVLFYRRMTDGIDIVRILHQRRDFERHL